MVNISTRKNMREGKCERRGKWLEEDRGTGTSLSKETGIQRKPGLAELVFKNSLMSFPCKI